MRWSEKDLAEHLERTGVRGQPSKADTSRPPFVLPGVITLDLPPPISVNRLRRIDWKAKKRANAWKQVADNYVFAAKMREREPICLLGISRFELTITLDESLVKIDADNGIKLIIDYLRTINLIEDDGPKHMRKLTVQWGVVLSGCRIEVTPL